MPDGERPLGWRQAALAVEARLRQLTGQAPERLDQQTIRSCYPRHAYVAAWRVSVIFSDQVTRRIDIVATEAFPAAPVRTALVDHPEALTWPHVEGDGILCLLPNMAEVNPDDPSAVAENLFIRSCRLIEELLEGSIVDRDFREEFLTYWAYKAHERGSQLYSLLKPAAPSREVSVWRGEGVQVVGEDAASLATWVRNRFGEKTNAKTRPAAFIWLDKPPLPAEYPMTAADLHVLARAVGDGAVQALDAAVKHEPDEVLAILGATGRGGAGLVAVKVPKPKQRQLQPRGIEVPLSRGFRPGQLPQDLLIDRYFSVTPVLRSLVSRADAAWIHGRDQDSRTELLLGKRVVVLGCGSVGAPVAVALAQAGVGKLTLVDPDTLGWPNVGRHPLGATAVGQKKAEALVDRLQADFPHLEFDGLVCEAQYLIRHDEAQLLGADLIIATTGSWAAESALNRWHVAHERPMQVLYGWTEAHACAGHAVAIGYEGGCLQCHVGSTGVPDFKVVSWPDGEDANREEPACGAHFQPYGPVELTFITAMISDLALDCLLNPPSSSLHRVFAAAERRILALSGRRSEQWLASHSESDRGAVTIDREWTSCDCAACGKRTEP